MDTCLVDTWPAEALNRDVQVVVEDEVQPNIPRLMVIRLEPGVILLKEENNRVKRMSEIFNCNKQ